MTTEDQTTKQTTEAVLDETPPNGEEAIDVPLQERTEEGFLDDHPPGTLPCESCDDTGQIDDMPCPFCNAPPEDESKAQPPPSGEIIGIDEMVQAAVDAGFEDFRENVIADINKAIDDAKSTLRTEWAAEIDKLRAAGEVQVRKSVGDVVKETNTRLGQIVGDGRKTIKEMTDTADRYKKHIDLASDRLMAFDAVMKELRDTVSSVVTANGSTVKAMEAMTKRQDGVDKLLATAKTSIDACFKRVDAVVRQLNGLQAAITNLSKSKTG